MPEASLVRSVSHRVTLRVVQLDLARAKANIVVISDNTRLSLSGGIGLAMLETAGAGILDRRDVETHRRLNRGERVVFGRVFESPPGSLFAERIFHVAVVDWDLSIRTTAEIVRASASECFRWAERYAVATASRSEHVGKFTIALPLMGAGAGGLTYAESLDAI